ncbi:hypothetical protein HBI56_029500 [Parastagonospora nodorum]|uniref:Uncharacterized protein n=1 Tax=Phaeosphaeria nodorum (strain SN15 / ATCC MYA-4574 / FGSC 10173) TaxID=321614 RepID=A0A7U2I0S6_PHANO|nr:hypothetical protein HBH56_017110 [Parastagonospora nodorum]QRC95157.1 hypothetical protein JI435_406920 [Parastagonospora nodorum SN15]KAH3937280.1 hypothetical protein HBH54_017360 [Parastagonospora nodorum]KAH3953625.1 hypothetical protein HBH53_029730 [Parastagonospora nodorum]KAH3962712.1 hypothetical protein HBH51_172250 [Parastagonospora nodorum]
MVATISNLVLHRVQRVQSYKVFMHVFRTLQKHHVPCKPKVTYVAGYLQASSAWRMQNFIAYIFTKGTVLRLC